MRRKDNFIEGTKDEFDALLKKEGVIVSEPIEPAEIVEKIEDEKLKEVPEIIAETQEEEQEPEPEQESPEEKIEDMQAGNIPAGDVKIDFKSEQEEANPSDERSAVDEFKDKIEDDVFSKVNVRNNGYFRQMQNDIEKLKGKAQEDGKPKSRRSVELVRRDYLFKELPFFRWEWIYYIIPTMVAFILVTILVIFEAFGIPVGILKYGPIFALTLFVAVTWMVYLVKIFKYMPIGKKKLVLRFLSNSLVYFNAEPISDGKVHFDKDDKTAPAFVTRENCHFDLSSGAPVIVVCEGEMENLHINSIVSEERRDRSATEFNSVVKQVFLAGWQAAAAQLLQTKDKLKQYSTILLVVTLIACIITVILVARLNLSSGDIMTALAGIKTALPATAAQAAAPAISMGP